VRGARRKQGASRKGREGRKGTKGDLTTDFTDGADGVMIFDAALDMEEAGGSGDAW
jgi:hypothetical protein